jgi:predicted nucleotide-binding protein
MERAEAEAAIQKLAEQRDELDRILNRLAESGDAVKAKDRFDRWKARTAEAIRQYVSPLEAERFEKTYVPLVMGAGELEPLRDEIFRHQAALDGLIEELTEHPEALQVGAKSEKAATAAPTATQSDEGDLPDVELTQDPRSVFVIHGRDDEARDAIFAFLRDLDLHPLEWEELVRHTGKGSPYNAEVVTRAFQQARAVVALFTPDDEARLHADLQGEDEPEHERDLTGQARPNVFIEAGMALQAQPERTILVEIGQLRPASDLSGMNAVRLGGGPGPLLALVTRLETAGCKVNRTNPGWMSTDRFKSLSAATRRPGDHSLRVVTALPQGQRLGSSAPVAAPPQLTAQLHQRGRDYLLEVVNRGGVTIKNVRWELPAEVRNWHFLTDVLPDYPVPEVPPRDYVRVPVSVAMGGPVIVEISLLGELEDGASYKGTSRLSIYD